MAIVEKGLGDKTTARPQEADLLPNIAVTKSAPRTSLDLSDWDNIKRQSETGDKERGLIPPHLIPDGFSVEWKRIELLGKPDNKNVITVEAAGWRPAPSELFRDILPSGYSAPFVEDGEGRRLYIRPLKFTEEANKEQYNIATQKVRDYEEATKNRVTGHRDVPNKVHAFSRSYEKGIPIPD